MTDPATIIDPHAIDNLRALSPGDNDEFLREITGIFLDDTPLRIRELEESLAAGDEGKFVRAAHSIKGSAANLGAVQVRAIAEALEHRSRADGLAGLAPLIGELITRYAGAEVELRKLIARR